MTCSIPFPRWADPLRTPQLPSPPPEASAQPQRVEVQAHTRKFPERKPKAEEARHWCENLKRQMLGTEWAELEQFVLAGLMKQKADVREEWDRSGMRRTTPSVNLTRTYENYDVAQMRKGEWREKGHQA